ncbi:histidine kinase dimerization/phospho-acceptor domain-containing protein [Trichormus azollae]|jgi:signal transduction histidine kinase|nr:histidine kinase dimerization/phospho-acceptor domain-containing protein [Trichormus azollae]
MSNLGQLLGGITHEVNNPLSFINGNINHAGKYINDLLKLVDILQ